MVGQDLARQGDIAACVVLIQQNDGTQTGWHVFNVSAARWDWAGLGPNGSRAQLTVTGDFHRINREGEPPLPQIGDIT